MLLSFIPMQLNAATEIIPSATVATKPAESAEANALIFRLDEIKAMDKSKMSRLEKRQLRKEVRSIQKNLADLGRGVYLSAGAIIIIILLLILLL